MYPSTLSSAILLLAKALDARGINSRKLVFKAGMDPHKLDQAGARYPAAHIVRLWELAIEETGEPSIGVEIAAHWHPNSFHALGYAWLASTTLKDALQCLVRYVRIINSGSRLSLDEEACLRAEPSDSSLKPLRHIADSDAGAAVVLRMCREIAGEDFTPRKVMLMRPKPNKLKSYRQAFRAPVEFSAAFDGILFDPADLNVELPTGNIELARANEQVIKNYLARFSDDDLVSQVRCRITEMLPSGQATREKVAQALYYTPRTFQRRLNEAGTTYNKILDDVRRELALEYISESDMPIKEVCYLMGFDEPGNFTRAFKRWSGCSPSEYRQSACRVR